MLEFGRTNLQRCGLHNIELHLAARRYGHPAHAPYDKILVSAASRNLPEELVGQLRPQGFMVLPVRDAIWRVEKKSRGDLTIEKYEGFSFVPLVRD